MANYHGDDGIEDVCTDQETGNFVQTGLCFCTEVMKDGEDEVRSKLHVRCAICFILSLQSSALLSPHMALP